MSDDTDAGPHAVVIPLRGPRPSEDARIRELSRGHHGDEETEELVRALSRRAERALAEGRARHALRDCDRVIDTQRAGPLVYWVAAQAHAALGNWERGAAQLEHAVSLAPTSGQLWAALALFQRALGDDTAAMHAARRGLELDEGAADPWAVLAEIGTDINGPLSKFERSWYYEQAIERDPGRADWIARRARLRAGGVGESDSLRDAERALAMSPDDPQVILDHALVLAHHESERARAKQLLSELGADHSYTLEDRCAIADALFDLHLRAGTGHEAYGLLADLANEADDGRRWAELAEAAVECRRAREALFAAASAYSRAPGDPDVVRSVGETFARLGAWRAADDVLSSYLAMRPDDSDAFSRRASVRVQRKMYKRAAADWDRGVEVAADLEARVRALTARAGFRWKRGDAAGALDDHNRRVRIDRGPWARFQRGELYYELALKSGENQALRAARRDFEAAIRIGNEDAYGYRALLRELGRGDYEASRRDLERAIENGIGVRNWWQDIAELHARYGRPDAAEVARQRAVQARWAIDLVSELQRAASSLRKRSLR